MFLDVTRRRNPGLVRAAVQLHRAGRIWPNTYLVDIDAVEENARLIAGAARLAGISLYFMTKQVNRNPEFGRCVAAQGIPKAVAVDWEEAFTLSGGGVAVGHAGHLVQLPSAVIRRVLAMGPEVVTVFSLEKAAEIAHEAAGMGIEQPLLLRVVGDGDWFYPGQVGGIPEKDLVQTAKAIMRLKGVRVAGVTSFPCLSFDEERGRATPTPNMATLRRAALTLKRELGITVEQVNAPSMTAAGTVALLAREGATHGEPGHALTGTTPLHAHSDQPEIPAVVYVSEVSHVYGDRAYCYGGGFYHRSNARAALVGSDPDGVLEREAEFEGLSTDSIDYYGALATGGRFEARVGDTVVFAFRAQMFTSRSYLGLIRGAASGRPRLVAVYDHRGRRRRSLG